MGHKDDGPGRLAHPGAVTSTWSSYSTSSVASTAAVDGSGDELLSGCRCAACGGGDLRLTGSRVERRLDQAWSERSARPAESEIVIRPGANTAAFDVDGDAASGPSEDKFGMTRQPAEPPRVR